MYGDRPGSPRRDDRQNSAPHDPLGPAYAAPQPDDVKVAGSPYGAAPLGHADAPGAFGGGGDTATMGAVQAEPQGTAVALAEPPPYPGPAGPMGAGPADEIGNGIGDEPPRHHGRRSGGRRGGVKIAAMAAGAAVVVGGGAIAAVVLTGGDDGKATVSSAPLADAATVAPPVDPKVLEEQRRKEALNRASRAARKGTGKSPALMPKGSPIPTKTPKPSESGAPSAGNPVPAGVAQAYAKSIMDNPSTQFGCLVNLWNKESNWNYKASNPSSGAYGIPQALPGSKMASEGDDWRTNYKTQIRWGLGYIENRYGSPCEAWAHSKRVGWY
ncbi:hypothetical protein GCM10023085_28470 [Actinomadura viridis]|uniref:Lytic transglycosylase domain-containing protein n=1 Tax=Actinomadura viridis TaxID=58110 RepID=A0A931GHR0_9ACTN|nr:lytic transglycosylase domain-containing protein [Actinomadura viridis]MBG6087167.1 hypothetical protein [Actinomadura viridis]